MKSLIVLQYEWSSVRKFNPWLGFGLGLGLRGNFIRGHCPRTKWSYPLESFFFFSAFPVCFFTRLDVFDSATPFWDKVETFLNKVILRNQVILFLYLLLPYVIYDYLCQLSLSILPNLFLRDCLYDSRHGRINKIRLVISFWIYCSICMKPGRFSSRPDQARFLHRRNNNFHINTVFPRISTGSLISAAKFFTQNKCRPLIIASL